MLPLDKQFSQSSLEKTFVLIFIWIREWQDFFSHFFLVFWKEWSFLVPMTKKECYLYTNSFNSHHWKNFSCWFSFKNGSERTFSNTFYLVFWKEWSFLILMTYKECYLYTNSFYGHHWKIFSCWFPFKNGSERIFLTLFDWSSEKSEVFSTLCLIRSATPIQTVFTDIIGKTFSADFHLKTGVREFFQHFLIGLLERVKIFHPYDL